MGVDHLQSYCIVDQVMDGKHLTSMLSAIIKAEHLQLFVVPEVIFLAAFVTLLGLVLVVERLHQKHLSSRSSVTVDCLQPKCD
eukprot:13258285-Ditylum_brightwellii.AAC.1